MNETLETIARGIFKSWFVDFAPVSAKTSGEPPESIRRRLQQTPDLHALFPDRLVNSELGEIPEKKNTTTLGRSYRDFRFEAHTTIQSRAGGPGGAGAGRGRGRGRGRRRGGHL